MNEALFCSIHVDSSLARGAMASLVAELTGGVVAHGNVDLPWGQIAVDDDYGMFERRVTDADDFLGWPTLLEIMPFDSARREEVVPAVVSLMKALIVCGMRVLAQSEYAEALPGGGEVAGIGRRDGEIVTKYEINKFPPSLFKDGRFLREDWTACTDIGRATPRGILSKQEYLRIEGLYVDAIAALARAVEPDLLSVHDLEFWDTTNDRLAGLGLADVFSGSNAPAEGELVASVRLDNLVRRCLREAAWLELMVVPKLLVHFGYDMRLIVASSIPLAEPLGQIRSSGLFVYGSDASLLTLDAWVSR